MEQSPMFATEHLQRIFQFIMVMGPAGVYFLILGFLNTRRCPQLLSGRRDFVILLTVMSPAFILPVLYYAHWSPLFVIAICTASAPVIGLLVPRGYSWVIYNITPADTRDAIARTLRSLQLEGSLDGQGGFRLPQNDVRIRIAGFSLLSNVSVHLDRADRQFAHRFAAELGSTLRSMRVEVNPMGTTMLLIAMAMLVAPLGMMTRRVPEIVRILTDLLP